MHIVTFAHSFNQFYCFLDEIFFGVMLIPLEYLYMMLVAKYGEPEDPDDPGGGKRCWLRSAPLFFVLKHASMQRRV